jgi:predicted nucleic acid-binding protein
VRVLIDTSIWSYVLRRVSRPTDATIHGEMLSLIDEERIALIGAIRQELLSGIREGVQFERLRDHLDAFPDEELVTDDYVRAAAFSNACRARGIQGSTTDFLICSVAASRELAIYTADGDFQHFVKVLPIVLHTPGG